MDPKYPFKKHEHVGTYSTKFCVQCGALVGPGLTVNPNCANLHDQYAAFGNAYCPDCATPVGGCAQYHLKYRGVYGFGFCPRCGTNLSTRKPLSEGTP